MRHHSLVWTRLGMRGAWGLTCAEDNTHVLVNLVDFSMKSPERKAGYWDRLSA